MTKTLKTLIPLSIVCALLIGFSYTQSAWTEPAAGTVAATNVAPPINTGTEDQVKAAGLGVDALAVYGDAAVDNRVMALAFCDPTGATCLSGANLQYKLPVCTNGQTLVSDASGIWVCGAPSAAAPPATAWLVNSQHSETQCTAIGGTVVTGSSAEKFCFFNQGSCPSGWAQHQNWSTYAAYNTGSPVTRGCYRGSDGGNYYESTYQCAHPGQSWQNASAGPVTITQNVGMCGSATLTCQPRRSQIGCY